MPPTNSTFRGPCPRVFTRIERPCTDFPTTSQPVSAGVVWVRAVVGGGGGAGGVVVGPGGGVVGSGEGVAGVGVGSAVTVADGPAVVWLAAAVVQPATPSPVASASATMTVGDPDGRRGRRVHRKIRTRALHAVGRRIRTPK